LGEALGSGDPDAIAAAKATLDRVTADAHASGVFDHGAAFSVFVFVLVLFFGF
ncbi:unnamed protein product, partial [Rotaria socialis]